MSKCLKPAFIHQTVICALCINLVISAIVYVLNQQFCTSKCKKQIAPINAKKLYASDYLVLAIVQQFAICKLHISGYI